MSVSLSRYLVEQQRAKGHIPPSLRLLLEVVARACKSISHAVNKGELGGVLGTAYSENVQGEVQKKLDIIANEVLIEANEWGGHLAAMASEEMDSIYLVPNRYPQGEYLLLFDPLDGSSNIDVNVSIGTIFSVLKKPEGSEGVSKKTFCEQASNKWPPAIVSMARRPPWCSHWAMAWPCSPWTASRALLCSPSRTCASRRTPKNLPST